ncbi:MULTISPECIES: M20 family metallopeptidase [Cytobacillus]|uniref:M20 family metallopeptidase n=1 Tax=Cytobacillus TaxID=2675230 RepID=UPI001CD7B8F0|nr:M20 family metallopeptidase [Cytobacillus kochii]MCA1024818.1 M20 family metallopeptidase [Cytobacillus kochii]MCM3323699.1 M20 family metallopeptidase [Cytobacillus kochii]MCM3346120.1 M20 family metallopeptidase [Cytobacillus kochii]MDM5206510.1 M20 family metallopeptidase [Cytobacillus kochii]
MEKLFALLKEYEEEMISIRRFLHEYPEISYQEVKTPAYIADYHEKLGHDVRTGVGGRGVVATLRGGKPGKTVALRADFDALAIQEENDLPYKSKIDGAMHACGHDGHTATLLVLAKALNKIQEDIEGTIVFIHQFAEEIAPGGAISMIEDGCLDGVDAIFGTHIWSTFPLGTIQVKEGPIMAAADQFNILIQGQGGHGSEPHLTKDAVMVGSQFVASAQQIVSRRANPLHPAVVSVGHFEALNPFNVIADTAKLIGTVRTFDEDTRDLIEKELDNYLSSTCQLFGATYDYQYKRGYPAVVNHPEEAAFIANISKEIEEVTEVVECDPLMGGEDFAYYLQHVKGAFFFTGAQDPNWQITYPHHHPRFNIDERSLLIAAKTLGTAALKFLEGAKTETIEDSLTK